MTRSRGRGRPSDPLEAMEQRARARAADRANARDPSTWGVSAEILHLPTSADIDPNIGDRGKILAARRSDPFDLLHAAGGLSDDQHRASRRLFRDWCLRAGVRDGHEMLLEKTDGGRADPSGRFNQVMIDAGGRVADALKGVGPVNRRLLSALISPMVDQGAIIAWRGAVIAATGEKDRTTQGALVRQACEALREIYLELDRERLAEPTAEIRPFGTFYGGGQAA